MKRTLLLLNLLLLVGVAVSAWELQKRRVDDEAQQARFLNTKPQAANEPPPAPNKPALPATPQAYVGETVQKFLFSKDRNPNVMEKPVVKPPEPVMPALPALYGVFLIGEPTIFLGVGTSGQRGYRAGDRVGDFKLLAFDKRTVTFEWNGKPVERSMDSLAANQAKAAVPVAAAAPPPNGPPVVEGSKNGQLGQDIGADQRACVPGDSSPAGTVVDGYSKWEKKTPFGVICHWAKQ